MATLSLAPYNMLARLTIWLDHNCQIDSDIPQVIKNVDVRCKFKIYQQNFSQLHATLNNVILEFVTTSVYPSSADHHRDLIFHRITYRLARRRLSDA